MVTWRALYMRWARVDERRGHVDLQAVRGAQSVELQVRRLGPQRGDDAGGMGVVVGVDADDGVDLVCQHGYGPFLPGGGAVESTPAR